MELGPGVDSGNHFPKTPGTTQRFRVIPLQDQKGPLQLPYVVPKHGLSPAELAVGGLVLVVGEDVEPKDSRRRLPRVEIFQCRHHIKELVSPGMRHKGGGLFNMATTGGGRSWPAHSMTPRLTVDGLRNLSQTLVVFNPVKACFPPLNSMKCLIPLRVIPSVGKSLPVGLGFDCKSNQSIRQTEK